MKKVLDGIALALIPFVAALLIKLLAATMRFTYVNFDSYRERLEGDGQIILAFWHGRLMMMPYSYPGNGITVLVSLHRDGELVARTVRYFGIKSVRGSSTRGWFAGIKGLLKSVHAGGDIAITPDGPKGPALRAQMGAVQIAARTALPIIPMAFGASKKKTFKSWDSFLVPLPFSKGVFISGEPITVSRDAGAGGLEKKRLELEGALNELTRQADGFFKQTPSRTAGGPSQTAGGAARPAGGTVK
ncbi:MAG: lysophospholipid acyltransferase family protein [Deltaproteobacteria bacterium]|nr:lysophospholipid acyltransferase family protein [Deltaproteobacteria bacterium]